MISVVQAQQKTLEAISLRPKVKVPLQKATGRILAEEIHSPINIPSFNNSAMDGYALCFNETREASVTRPVSLEVTSTIMAGDAPKQKLRTQEAMRIFTGAMIPPEADAVVKQEDVVVLGPITRDVIASEAKQSHEIATAPSVPRDDIHMKIAINHPVKPGENVRCQGEELHAKEQVFEAGTPLTPAAIATCASLGLSEVSIYSPPRVGIIVTGSEIITDPSQMEPGKIFDSNSYAISTALKELHITPSFLERCPDNKEMLHECLSRGLAETDFLIVTGGVSVGDYDFVREVSKDLGIEEIFWKVKQKPGKPIFFGKGDKTFLFGLPGNPASVLVCYYEYVRSALLHAMGARSPFLPELFVPLANHFKKKGGRFHFLKAYLKLNGKENQVEILEKQGSHMLTSFAHANCLALVPGECEEVSPGDLIKVHLLPSIFMGECL